MIEKRWLTEGRESGRERMRVGEGKKRKEVVKKRTEGKKNKERNEFHLKWHLSRKKDV